MDFYDIQTDTVEDVLLNEESLCNFLLKFKEMPGIKPEEHVLSSESLSFSLQGREKAISKAIDCFKNLYERQVTKSTTVDKTKYQIPVCSGIPGLGKTCVHF
jgi:hypothetical protein